MITAKVKVRMNPKWIVWVGESLDVISETVARLDFLFEIATLEEIPLEVAQKLPHFEVPCKFFRFTLNMESEEC